MACICYGFFIMLGTVGWRASLMFVRHIYKVMCRVNLRNLSNCQSRQVRSGVLTSSRYVCRPSNANDAGSGYHRLCQHVQHMHATAKAGLEALFTGESVCFYARAMPDTHDPEHTRSADTGLLAR